MKTKLLNELVEVELLSSEVAQSLHEMFLSITLYDGNKTLILKKDDLGKIWRSEFVKLIENK
jgi:hypothetical protein